MTCSIKSKILLLVSILILSSAHSQNATKEYQKDRFSATIGGFYTGLNSNLIVGVDQLGIGLSLGLEDALGLESSAIVLRGNASYTLGKNRNKRLSIGYIGLLRRSEITLGRELEIGDKVFPLETRIQSKFNLEIYEGSYNWGFFQDERMRIGLGGGLFLMPLGFSIAADDNESEFFQFIAPLPSLELSTEFYLSPRWTYSQTLNIFYISFDTFNGSLTDLSLNLDYQPFDHFSFGAGLNSFKLNFETIDDLFLDFDFKGSVETSYFGVFFYAKYLIKYKD
jgi:hypothetical protein